MPPLVLGFLSFLTLGLLSTALGLRVLDALNVRVLSRLERGVIAASLGLGLLQFVPFALFALGIGSPACFRLTIVGLSILLIPRLLRILRALPSLCAGLLRLPIWQRVLVGFLALLFAAIFLRSVCPITDEDGLSYHLTAAVRFLEAGRFVYLPTITPTNWPLGVESLFALVLGLHAQAPPAIVQFLIGMLTVGATFLLARRYGGVAAAWSAISLLLFYPLPWRLMTFAHVDLGTMLFATTALLLLVSADYQHTDARVYVSAILAGLGATTKLTGVWVVIAFAIAAASTVSQRSMRDRTIFAGRLLLVGVFPLVPWLLRTLVLTGNPIYPLFHQFLGGIEYSAAGWERYQYSLLLFNTPPGLPPTPHIILLTHIAIAATGLALALLTFRFTRQSQMTLPLRFSALFTAGICFGSYYNPRFILAALPALAAYISLKICKYWPRLVPYGCMAAGFMVFPLTLTVVEPDLKTAWNVAIGAVPIRQYLAAKVPDYEVAAFANRTLSVNSRLLIGTWEKNTTHYRGFAYWPDYWLQDSLHYDSQARLEQDLARLGITHIVFRPIDYDWCDRSYVCQGRRDAETPAIAQLVNRRGKLLYRSGKVCLYALDSGRNQIQSRKDQAGGIR